MRAEDQALLDSCEDGGPSGLDAGKALLAQRDEARDRLGWSEVRRRELQDQRATLEELRRRIAELEEENAHFRAAVLETEDDPTKAIDEADAQAGRRRAARRRPR